MGRWRWAHPANLQPEAIASVGLMDEPARVSMNLKQFSAIVH